MSMQAEAVDQEPVEIKEEPIQIDVKVKEEHDEFLEILPSTSKSILDDDKEDLRASLKIEHEQDIKILPSTSKFDSEDDFFDEDQGKKEMPEFKEEMMSEDEDDESDFEQEGLSDDGGEGPSNIKTEELMIKSESGESDSSKTHMVNEEDEQYSCNRCNFNTRSRAELDKHMTSMHEKATNDFMSNYMSYLNQHACDLCEYKTYSKRVLGDHMLALHPEKIIKKHLCHRCEFITDSERDLTEHIVSVHLDKKTYACDFCDYKSIWKNRIKKHVKAIHDKYLNRIDKPVVAKKLACDFCDYKTNIYWQLARHISVKHDNGTVKMHTTLTYVCDLCDYKTHTKAPLTRHLKSHQVMASLNETGKN